MGTTSNAEEKEREREREREMEHLNQFGSLKNGLQDWPRGAYAVTL